MTGVCNKNYIICCSSKDGDDINAGMTYLIYCIRLWYEYGGKPGLPLCIRIKEYLVWKFKVKQDQTIVYVEEKGEVQEILK